MNLKAIVTSGGFILNNLTIEQSNKDNKYDLKINTENSLDSSKYVLKFEENYKLKDLKKLIEDSGYKCK